MADSKATAKPGGGIAQLAMVSILVGAMGLGAGFGLATTFDSGKEQAGPVAGESGGSGQHQTVSKQKADSHAGPSHAGTQPEGHAEEEALEHPVDEVVDLSSLVVTPLPNIVTNLSEPNSVWVRLEGNATVVKDTEIPHEKLAANSAQQILAYLRTLTLADLQGPESILHLSQDIDEVVRAASNGQVQSIIISGLIVE